MVDGLVLKIQIYSGTDRIPPADRIYHFTSHGTKGCHFFTDNWYNSVSLTECMSKRNIYITSTFCADRKWNLSQRLGKKLRKGEMVFMSLGEISVTKWKDKRDVCVISNAHVPTMIDQINRHDKSKTKPNVVHICNNHMLGIDQLDRMLSYHSALWKPIRRYKNVGIHIIEIFLNAIAKVMKDFRESKVTNLTGPHPPNHYLKPQASFRNLSTIPPTEKKTSLSNKYEYFVFWNRYILVILFSEKRIMTN